MAATLWVAFGGAIGSVSRYWLGIGMENISKTLPWGTILINIGGSFIIALFAALTLTGGRFPVSENARLFVMVGLCGGFTTFSSFSLQTLALLRDGAFMRAFLNIIISVLLCLIAAAFGWWVAERINAPAAPEQTVIEEEIS